MDGLNTLNMLVQGGSFAVLVFLVIWVVQFVPKRIAKTDQLRELEAEAKKESANALHKAVVEQEKSQTARIERILEVQTANTEKLIAAHTNDIQMILAAHGEQLRYERETCEKRHNECISLLAVIRKEGTEDRQKNYDILRDISHSFKDIQQVLANERTLRKFQQEGRKPPGSK